MLLPGSLLVAWSADLNQLQSAAAAIDAGHAPSDVLAGSLDGLAPAAVQGDLLDAWPAFAAIRYRGRDLVDPAVLPPVPEAVGCAVLPWVGLPLDPEQFSIVSWLIPGAAQLAALVVCNPPHVDEDDRRLLAQLPMEVAELGVEPAATPVVAATFVATVLAERAVNAAADWAGRNAAEQYRDWARDNQRRQDAAERRAAAQNFANRTRWRNASFAPPDRSLAETSEPPVGATIEELLNRRIAALRPPQSPGRANDDSPPA